MIGITGIDPTVVGYNLRSSWQHLDLGPTSSTITAVAVSAMWCILYGLLKVVVSLIIPPSSVSIVRIIAAAAAIFISVALLTTIIVVCTVCVCTVAVSTVVIPVGIPITYIGTAVSSIVSREI